MKNQVIACKEKYIIFGAGKVGTEVLELLGPDQVICMIDNNFDAYNDYLHGVPIVDVNRIMDFYAPNVTVIIASVVKKNIVEMACQLNAFNIPYVFYEDMFDGIKFPITERQINAANGLIFLAQNKKGIEEYDYYEFTTSLLVKVVHDYKLYDKIALSLGGKVGGVITVANLFCKVFHCSMMPMLECNDFKKIYGDNKLIEFNMDFWELEDDRLRNVEVMFSHAAIHCLNDTRYGNKVNDLNRIKNVPRRLKEICPKLKYIVISVPVNMDDHFMDNNTWLGNDDFIDAFESVGYRLNEVIYDKKCLGDNKWEDGERFSMEFPAEYCLKHKYIVGNFFFLGD